MYLKPFVLFNVSINRLQRQRQQDEERERLRELELASQTKPGDRN